MPVVDGALDTFPKLLLRHAEAIGDHPAIREKDLGIWQAWTWREMRDEVEWLACGLAQAGLTRGAHIAIIGSNRPRLYWTIVAAQSLGAIPVPFYEDAARPGDGVRLPGCRDRLRGGGGPGAGRQALRDHARSARS